MNLLAALNDSFVHTSSSKKLSTGLSVLNYALSGDVHYGIDSGSVVLVSGGVNSGRTTLGLTMLAEAAINKQFDPYTLVYYDTEGKAVDIKSYLGSRADKRIFRGAVNSLDAFWDYCSSAVNRVIVLDSLDGLMVEGQWKTNNRVVKGVFDCVRRNDSILIITVQEKLVQNKRVNAGGYALRYYSDFILRSEFDGEYYKRGRGRKVYIGTDTTVSVIKSKFDGDSKIKCPAPIVVGYGYDNAVSLLTFLRNRGIVKETEDNTYEFPEYGFNGSYSSILRFCRDYEDILSFKVKEYSIYGLGRTRSKKNI